MWKRRSESGIRGADRNFAWKGHVESYLGQLRRREILGTGGSPRAAERLVAAKGLLVCDIDTGVNYYHANFFALSGESYDWLDLDLSGDLTPGDMVDLDDDTVLRPAVTPIACRAARTVSAVVRTAPPMEPSASPAAISRANAAWRRAKMMFASAATRMA